MEGRQRCYITAVSSPSTMPRVCPRCGIKICCWWRLDTQSAHECWKISTDRADRSWYWGGGLCSNVIICVMNYLNTPWRPGGWQHFSALKSHDLNHMSVSTVLNSHTHFYRRPRNIYIHSPEHNSEGWASSPMSNCLNHHNDPCHSKGKVQVFCCKFVSSFNPWHSHYFSLTCYVCVCVFLLNCEHIPNLPLSQKVV